MNADYWYQGIRRPVLFEQAMRNALDQEYRQFIEVAPRPVLRSAIQDSAADTAIDVGVVRTLRCDAGDTADFTGALAEAHANGIQLAWSKLCPDAEEVDLPTLVSPSTPPCWTRPCTG